LQSSPAGHGVLVPFATSVHAVVLVLGVQS
jgi:hypothetical protein